MQKKIEWQWEKLDANTSRVRVIGGWIVHHDKHALAKKGNSENILCSESMVFIADRDHEWFIIPPVDETIALKEKAVVSDFESSK